MTPRGGKRTGAGRPALRGERKRQVGIMLPPSLDDWLVQVGQAREQSRSELIAEALEVLRAGGPASVPEVATGSTATTTGSTAATGDALAYRALLAALAAAEPPGGFASTYKLPDDLASQVADFAGLPAGKTPELEAALARMLAVGLVASRHVRDAGHQVGERPETAADVEACRALVAALRAAEAPTDAPGAVWLPNSLADAVKALTGAQPGELPATMALVLARGLVASKHLAEHPPQ